MSRSIRSARTDHLAPPAPQYAATRAAAGRWLLLKWGVLVVLCLCFWAALAGLLVAIS